MKKPSFIPYPTKQEIHQEIKQITEGVISVQPPVHQRFFLFIKHLGWRQILPNKQEWLYTLLIFSIVGLVLLYSAQTSGKINQPIYMIFLFMISPFMFVKLSLLQFYDKYQHATFDLEMTTKNTVLQFIIQRMIVYSILTLLTNSYFAYILAPLLNTGFLQLVLMMSSGLFSFALAILCLIQSKQILFKFTSFTVVWTVILSLFILFPHPFILAFMTKMPLVILGGLSGSLLLACYFISKRAYHVNKKEVSLC